MRYILLFTSLFVFISLSLNGESLEKKVKPSFSKVKDIKPQSDQVSFEKDDKDFQFKRDEEDDESEEEEDEREEREIDIEAIEEFFQNNAPIFINRYEQLGELDEEEMQEEFLYYADEIMFEYEEMMEDEPKLARQYLNLEKKEVESQLLGQEIQKLKRDSSEESLYEEEEIQSAHEKLKSLLNQIFEKRTRKYLEELEEELEYEEDNEELIEEYQLVKRRLKVKDSIIKRRIEDLTGESELLDWY